MDLELTGKRALVTGGSRGIGLAVARALAAEGADVAIAARTQSSLDAALDDLTGSGRRIVAVACDTGVDRSVEQMVAEVTDSLGGIDILVNNAATPGGQSVERGWRNVSIDELSSDMNVKVLGYLRCARAVAPQMVDRGWGRIVCIGGLAVRVTGSMTTSMRNAAVVAMATNMADELRGSGVTVNAVHPGRTRTERTADDPTRLTDASDVAAIVTFLASPRSAWINGESIVCGTTTPLTIPY